MKAQVPPESWQVGPDAAMDTVVTILSSWPDATDPAFEAAQHEALARVCDRLASIWTPALLTISGY